MTDLDFIRATALALRDLAESSGALEATFTFEGDVVLTWNAEDGFDLLLQGTTLDLTEWVDRVDFVPTEGVDGVQDQIRTLAERP